MLKNAFGYEGKTCVVTGAASGMGKATTEILVGLGAKVYALDLNECTVPGIEKHIATNLSKKESSFWELSFCIMAGKSPYATLPFFTV